MQKGKIMGKEKTRVERTMDLALERLEYIIDHRTTPDFVEVTGRMGGEPERIQNGVAVNFFGTLIGEQPLPLGEDKVLWLQEGDFMWIYPEKSTIRGEEHKNDKA